MIPPGVTHQNRGHHAGTLARLHDIRPSQRAAGIVEGGAGGAFTLEQADRPARPQPVERNKTVEQQTLDRYRRTSGVQRR